MRASTIPASPTFPLTTLEHLCPSCIPLKRPRRWVATPRPPSPCSRLRTTRSPSAPWTWPVAWSSSTTSAIPKTMATPSAASGRLSPRSSGTTTAAWLSRSTPTASTGRASTTSRTCSLLRIVSARPTPPRPRRRRPSTSHRLANTQPRPLRPRFSNTIQRLSDRILFHAIHQVIPLIASLF